MHDPDQLPPGCAAVIIATVLAVAVYCIGHAIAAALNGGFGP